jgi:hypothetical protein
MISKAEYERRIRRLIRDVARLDARARSKAVVLLRELKQRIDAQIAQTDFARFQQGQTKAAIGEMVGDFAGRYESELNAMDAEILKLSNEFHANIKSEAPRGFGSPVMTIPQLEIVQGFRADLIQKMKAETIGRISNEINLGALGGKSAFEVEKAIRPLVTPLRRKDGTTLGILARAETISRTESNRIFSLVQQAQQDSDAEFLKSRGIVAKKIWVATNDGRTRLGHAEAGQRYSIGGSIGPIPISEPFRVRPTLTAPFENLMFPLDPSGGPANTIQCRCVSATITEELVTDFAA